MAPTVLFLGGTCDATWSESDVVGGDVVGPVVRRVGGRTSSSPYGHWRQGPSGAGDYFPIAVWLQNPARAGLYRDAGFNLYVGLWNGPTEQQLQQLKDAGLQVICSQNKVGLEHRNDPTIVGWMHGDEPDNAQSLGSGKGYGPPILPEKIVASYERLRATDPNRPVLLNLGQGVAWDDYIGRGVRRNHPEDYPEYVKGCDIASFDIYPAAHENAKIAGNLWYVAVGVERLKQWAQGRPVWNCIECTRINNKQQHKATPQQVRCGGVDVTHSRLDGTDLLRARVAAEIQ